MQKLHANASNGRVDLPLPDAKWIWILVNSAGSNPSLSITAETPIECSHHAIRDDGTVSSWILQPTQKLVFLDGVRDDDHTRCYIGELPKPLERFVENARYDQAEMLGEMLEWTCSDPRTNLALPSGMTSIERFDLLRGNAAIARRLGNYETETKLLKAALKIRQSSNVMRLLSYAYANSQDYPQAIVTARKAVEADPELANGPFQSHLLELQAYTDIKNELEKCAQTTRRSSPKPPKIAYCLHNALPFAQGGYAMRSHALAEAVINNGRDLIAFARPGFPSDGAAPSIKFTGAEMIDGVPYRYDNSFGRRNRSYGYVTEAADYFERIFRAENISMVHAATNFWTALPAAMAAYRLQLPFIYEVRSFWSITREARQEGFANTPQGKRDDALERIVLAMADQIITLNKEMRNRIGSEGVDFNRVSIVPNSVDADDFSPKPANAKIARRHRIEKGDVIIGYLGAMVGYEGLDMLIEASAPLITENANIRLIIVGADPAKKTDPSSIESMLIDQISKLGLSEQVTLVNRVAPSEVQDYYHLFDICVYPRRGHEVCELVSPLKPLEAMAAANAVIVSDVKGLSDIVRDEETALVFAKDNVEALSAKLKRAIYDEKLRDELGKAAQTFVRTERSWQQAARITQETYIRAESFDGSGSKTLGELVNSIFA